MSIVRDTAFNLSSDERSDRRIDTPNLSISVYNVAFLSLGRNCCRFVLYFRTMLPKMHFGVGSAPSRIPVYFYLAHCEIVLKRHDPIRGRLYTPKLATRPSAIGVYGSTTLSLSLYIIVRFIYDDTL